MKVSLHTAQATPTGALAKGAWRQSSDGWETSSCSGWRWGRRSVPCAPEHAPGKAPALGEVFGVVWVVGVGGPFDFNVAFNLGAGHLVEFEHARLVLDPLGLDAEPPRLAGGGEVLVILPRLGLFGVAAGDPAPKLIVNIVAQPDEGPFGGSVAVVIGPTAQQRVELTQERRLRAAQSGLSQP